MPEKTLTQTTIESETETHTIVETYAIITDSSGTVIDYLLIRTDSHPQ